MYKKAYQFDLIVLRTTSMTPVKLQIKKVQAEKSCQLVINELRRLYSLVVRTRER